MNILFLTHYFPPEVNAPAIRTYEHAVEWVKLGHKITIITNHPHHPHGRVFTPYKNKWLTRETMDGVNIIRVWTYLTANEGIIKRTLNYTIFGFQALYHSNKIEKPDIVVGTSPQFFCGLSAAFCALYLGKPFVLEVRDLWPDSILAVGYKLKGIFLKSLRSLETFLYNQAEKIVVNSKSYIPHIRYKLNKPTPIKNIPNGINLEWWQEKQRKDLVLPPEITTPGFHVAYVGTLGLAHGLGSLIDVGKNLEQEGVIIHLIGDGAGREGLLNKVRKHNCNNVHIHGILPHSWIPAIMCRIDALLVLLKDEPIFHTVIPSKIYEAMASGTPIIGAVRGEARRIIKSISAGICVYPEDVPALTNAILSLKKHPAYGMELGQNGQTAVKQHYNRVTLAQKFLNFIMKN